MHRVIVIQFVTLDGFTQDPDGAQGTRNGGWAFRLGPQAVAGDKFKMGELMDTGTLLLGRHTWQRFTEVFRPRSDEFSTKLNGMRKLVASRSLERVDDWNNSELLRGDLVDAVKSRTRSEDLIVAGSDSLVQLLMEHDLVDEYRLLIFPIALGEGRRLFRDGIMPITLQLDRVEQSGEAVLVTYHRPNSPAR